HAGLADGRETGKPRTITPLADRLRRTLATQLHPVWQQEISLNPAPALPPLKSVKGLTTYQFSMLGRILYSCLVDADLLDTEAFYNRVDNLAPRDDQYPSLVALRDQLDAFLNMPKYRNTEGVNAVRARILNHV